MTYTTDQFIATNRANLEALQSLTNQAVTGFEKLVELNMAASKAAVAESFSQVQAVLSAKDAQELLALQSAVFQPLAQKSAAYGRHVYDIVSSTGAELTKAFEAKLAETQKTFSALVDNAAKNAPAGSEAATALFKSAVSATQSAIETAQNAAKQAVSLAESNLTAVTAQAVEAVATPSRKR